MSAFTHGCKWPPDSVEQLRDNKTGLYDLSLRPCVDPDIRVMDPCESGHYKLLLSLYHGPALKNMSCLRQLYEMDKQVRMNGHEPNYALYPEMGNVQKLVHSIKAGKPVQTIPTNNPRLGIVQNPRGVCDNNASAYSQDLIVLVKSCVKCADQREHARQTYMQSMLWISFKVQFVFVVGLPAINEAEWLEYDGVRLRNPTKRSDDPISAQQYQQALLTESKKHGDLLIADFADSYFNLTLKQVTTFRWVSAFCRHTSAVYLFIDGDYSLVPAGVISMIHSIPLSLRLGINGGTFGPLRTAFRPIEKNKAQRWDVSQNEIPWKDYPQYSSGAAYLVGAEVVTDAAIAMAYTSFFRIDDVYLGFVWTKLHVPVMIIQEMRHGIGGLSDPNRVASLPTGDADQLIDWNTGRIRPKYFPDENKPK